MAKKSKDEDDDIILPGDEDEGQDVEVEVDEDESDDEESDEDEDEDDEGQDEDEESDEDEDELDEATSWLARILDFANENTDHENADVAAFARQVALLAEGEGQGEDDHIEGDFACHCGKEHDEAE